MNRSFFFFAIRSSDAQIFDAKASQQDVYDAAVQPLVEEVMEGFNCTVFACTCAVQ